MAKQEKSVTNNNFITNLVSKFIRCSLHISDIIVYKCFMYENDVYLFLKHNELLYHVEILNRFDHEAIKRSVKSKVMDIAQVS